MQGAKILDGGEEPHQTRLRATRGSVIIAAGRPAPSAEDTERILHRVERPVDIGVGVRERKVKKVDPRAACSWTARTRAGWACPSRRGPDPST
jgi:hypothetical protein